MSKNKKPPARLDQPRPSFSVSRLQQALGLGEHDWQSFLWHARDGFADFERDNTIDPGSTLRLRDVPAASFEDPDAIGYIALRVFNEGEPSLAVPVAVHLLRTCDAAHAHDPVPPGTGAAWLYLAGAGLAPPLDASRLVHFALDRPKEFFHAVGEDDLPAHCRLILEGRQTIDAWDLSALFIAIDRAQIHARALFRRFESLIAADWLATELKREFCRTLLGRQPELDWIEQRAKEITDALQADALAFLSLPTSWMELRNLSIAWRFPALKRHAVFALVENVGEPLPEVIDEFFLRPDREQQNAEIVNLGMLDLIGLHAGDLGPAVVKKLINKAIKCADAPVRQAAYRVGAEQFGLDFARPALKDEARRIKDWAAKLYRAEKVTPARKTTRKKRTESPA